MPPNVIVFLTDQQRWDTTGVHGNPLGLTPNFDRVARRGTHISHAFTPQPVCGPARACLQTGLYATQTGCFRNDIPLAAHHTTLAQHFNAGGYQTAYIGKWHLAEGIGAVPQAGRGGYQYWLASNVLEFTSDAYQTTLYNNDNQPVNLPGYRVDALTDAAVRYIDSHRAAPFFLFLSFIEPHHQNPRDDYPAPTGYREHYTRDLWLPPDLGALGGSAYQHLPGYYGMVKRLDEAFGRLLDALRSLGLLDNTIVLFTSDHGNHFKTRNSEYKRSPHDSSIRVPLALCGPGFDGGGAFPGLVNLVDLPPTLLDAAGLPVPDDMMGRSVLRALRDPAAGWPDDVFVQISEDQLGRVVRTRRWKYGVVAPEADAWDTPTSTDYTEAFLYDLYADPYELNNLVGFDNYAPVYAVMRARLHAHLQRAGEPAATIHPAPARSHPQLRVSEAEAHS